MAEYTFWKYKWAYDKNDPAVTFVAIPGRGYYQGYSASGAFRGDYLKTAEAATAAPVVAQPAAPEPVNQKFAGWGRVIPISMGQRRMSPQIIWLRGPISIGVTATADFAVSWGYNADDDPDATVVTALYADATLIWTITDGNLLPGDWSWTYYPGTETQMPDPTMIAANGVTETPAYRNQLYGVFVNFPLEHFGFKLPGISAEITGSGGEALRVDSWNPADKHPSVNLMTPLSIGRSTDLTTYTSAVRSRTFHRRGSYYLEMKFDNIVDQSARIFRDWFSVGVGVSLATARLDLPAGRENDGVSTAMPMVGPIVRYDLACWPIGVDLDTHPWGTGDTVGFHINMTDGYARARIVSHGGAWSAPLYYTDSSVPEHPSPGIAIGDSLYAHGVVASPGDWVTVNFGATPFLGALPSGATSWNGSGGVTDLGTLPLRDFISKISVYCGLVPETDLSFEGIDDVIHGGLITRDTTFSDFLTVLGRAYGFDFYEGEQIRIVRRVIGSTYVIDKVIPREDLIVEGDRSIQTTRRNDDAPTEIELSYIDRTQQFRWNIQKARRILFPVKTTRSVRKDAFAIPIITLADNALTMAGRALYREAMQNVDHEASMMPRHIAVEPSDILTITAGDTEYTVKVTSMAMNADCRLSFTAVNLLTDEDMAWTADAGSPNLPYAGNLYSMEAEEGPDEAFFSQFIGVLASMEGADGFAGLSNAGVMVAVDRPDTFAGATAAPGIMAATDRPDTFASNTDFTLVLDLDFTTM